eukprot:scaffold861_cov231-Chaetoceros_neogracile.AAC.1
MHDISSLSTKGTGNEIHCRAAGKEEIAKEGARLQLLWLNEVAEEEESRRNVAHWYTKGGNTLLMRYKG